jgi:hypothetical protein
MRMDTLKCLNDDELSLLLYIVNHIDPITIPKIEIGIKEIPWLRQDLLINKLSAQQFKLNKRGLDALQGLVAKITKYSHHEASEYECSQRPLFSQSEFQFEKT